MGSTHVVEQLSFSMLPSILTFDFDLILGSFLTFWGPNGLFFGVGERFKNFFFGSTHKVEHILFSMDPSILTIDSDSILGSFLALGVLMSYFWGRVQKLFLDRLMYFRNFIFYSSFTSDF